MVFPKQLLKQNIVWVMFKKHLLIGLENCLMRGLQVLKNPESLYLLFRCEKGLCNWLVWAASAFQTKNKEYSSKDTNLPK